LPVRIATWNVNSMKARMPRLLAWMDQRQPDVLLVQETKCADDGWPALLLEDRGYESAHLGSGRWNGVGVLSRVGLSDVTYGLPEQPAYDGVTEARAIGATCGGVRLWCVYVPNGRTVGSLHYDYKLEFYAALQAQARRELAEFPGAYGLLGDFNVAPHDDDVWDITAFAGHTHVSTPERAALQAVQALGLTDVVPRASATPGDVRYPYTFWEMRMLGFQKGRGMRIDLALANPALAERTREVWIDRDARKGQGPSDHAPLVLDLD